MIGEEQVPFLQENMMVTIESYEEQPISVQLPDQVVLRVVEADAVVKGQTAASSYKPAHAGERRQGAGAAVHRGRHAHRRRHRRRHLRRTRQGLTRSTPPDPAWHYRSPLLNVMTAAALKAAKGLIRDFGELEKLQVSKKGPADFVSKADRRAEADAARRSSARRGRRSAC